MFSARCLVSIAMLGASTIVPVVAADLTVAADGSGNFRKVQDAIDAAPKNQFTPTVIFIKPGTYKEKIRVPSDLTNLKLVGESYETTILTYDDCAGKTTDFIYGDGIAISGHT